MPVTTMEILIQKIFVSNFSWLDLEEYFNISRKKLMESLISFLSPQPCFALKYEEITEKLYENERVSTRKIELSDER